MTISLLHNYRSIVAKIGACQHQLARHRHSTAFKCPRCGLAVRPPVGTLPPRHCPECLGRARERVELVPPGEDSSGARL